MLGSISDAEDMVQDTYVSWLQTDQSNVINPKFYLIRIVSNKCIAHLNKVKKEREAQLRLWLPEADLSDSQTDGDPDRLTFGFMYLLEKLTPLERGIIILKEAFDLKHQEIATIFDISYENCRQYLSRAKKKLIVENAGYQVNTLEHKEILLEFLNACGTKNTEKLIALLREDIVVYSEGGGAINGGLKPIYGKENISRLFSHGMNQWDSFEKVEVVLINGVSGAAFYKFASDNLPHLLVALEVDEHKKIGRVFFLANPTKILNSYGNNFLTRS
jgi:RNA polymerase sigma-70 factor (ECF subfamily)